MRIVALENEPQHVSFRYRVEAFRPALRAVGHEVAYRTWPVWWMPWSPFWRDLERADAVIIQRRLFSEAKLARLRRAARVLVYDFDDAVFLRDSFDPRGESCEVRQDRFVRMIRAADAVIAGNRFLHEQAAFWTEPGKVLHVPTCVNPDIYGLARHDARACVQLAWIGSASTLRGLERIRGLFEELGEKQPGLNLKVICDRSLKLTHLPVSFCRWSKETESRELASADIGISWLPGDTWSRGKCGLKVLQYMAAGLPVVANPVGIHLELVRHGETGFLAQTPADWRAAIARLAAEPELRRDMGAAGRQRVERAYHVQQGAAAWLNLLTTFRHAPAVASACP